MRRGYLNWRYTIFYILIVSPACFLYKFDLEGLSRFAVDDDEWPRSADFGSTVQRFAHDFNGHCRLAPPRTCFVYRGYFLLIDGKQDDGRTVLFFAVGNADCTKLLIERGANVNATDYVRRTLPADRSGTASNSSVFPGRAHPPTYTHTHIHKRIRFWSSTPPHHPSQYRYTPIMEAAYHDAQECL